MSARSKWMLVCLGTVLVIGAVLFFTVFGPDDLRSYRTSGYQRMTAHQLEQAPDPVVRSMLDTVYAAFEATDEAAIYDGLAEVSTGTALESLYLERLGAMVGGGLDGSDQQIHEMELGRLTSRRSGTTVEVNAQWQVVGTVGHDTHSHVRGNAYAADLTLEPVDGAWRLTAFKLTDVDRSTAGTTFAAP